MKKIILFFILLLLIPLVYADSDNTFHTARIGSNDTYFNSWMGDGNLGQFFDKGFLTLQEEILENIQWFNTGLFRTNTTAGAISYMIMLATVIGMVTLAEVTINPALMLLAGMAMFFFAWLLILSVSILVGFFLIPLGSMYVIRIIGVVKD